MRKIFAVHLLYLMIFLLSVQCAGGGSNNDKKDNKGDFTGNNNSTILTGGSSEGVQPMFQFSENQLLLI
jgi:hypothetical protein